MNKPANGYRFPEETYKSLDEEQKIIYGDNEKRIIKIKKYVEEFSDTFRSVIVLDGRLGSYDVKRVFGVDDALFSNPKPVDLLRRIVSFVTSGDDLCVDLFAGSASLQEAVTTQNRIDGEARRAMSIQIPEAIPITHAAAKHGYNTIAQLSLARARKVVSQLEGQGVRVFRLGASNIRRWTGVEDKTAEGYLKQMEAFADTLVPGWKPEGVIWEVALREGYPLTASVTAIAEAAPPECWRVSDEESGRAFTICLADTIDLDSVKPLGLTQDDLFVCRDTALNDTVAANLALQCRLKVL